MIGAWGTNTGGPDGAGAAYLYFGGKNPDTTSDRTFRGEGELDFFGHALSAAGDVNGDGYDDFLVGAPGYARTAYLFLGGQNVDTSPDAKFSASTEWHGDSHFLSGAGDVNGDGYDDFMIGHIWEDSTTHVYYGGQNLDTNVDVYITGPTATFGWTVSEAGDVNGDGYDDVVIGGMTAWSGGPGASMICFGGKEMDGSADVNLTGYANGDHFGYSVAGGRDVNGDGYDDVLIGAPANATLGQETGAAYIFYGGAQMDNASDREYPGYEANSQFGNFVELAGDVLQDGFSELLIGATSTKKAYLFGSTKVGGINDTNVLVGEDVIWNLDGPGHGRYKVQNFATTVYKHLMAGPTAFKDPFGNEFVKIYLGVTASNEGNVTLSNLEITYQATIPTIEFSQILNDYIDSHQFDKDSGGNITIPIKVQSTSAGRVRALDLSIEIDEAPKLIRDIPSAELPEDTARDDMLDLWGYFKDDYDAAENLSLRLHSSTNATFVRVGLRDNRFITADSSSGSENDNWTGEAEVVIECADTRGHSVCSNIFKIMVLNTNDAPVFITEPVTSASIGKMYYYLARAMDIDDDQLVFRLVQGPPNMTLNESTGVVRWIPTSRGRYNVSIEVSDRQSTARQDYMISVPNRPPRALNATVPEATIGVPYEYQIQAVDEDNDSLEYILSAPVSGMVIDRFTGKLSRTPPMIGYQPVFVDITDGIDKTAFNFTIKVRGTNNAPLFSSQPVETALAGLPYSYTAIATDRDDDELSYTLLTGPNGMVINTSTGKVDWTPAAAGQFAAKVKVSDGRGGEAVQEFLITVKNRTRPVLNFTSPSEGFKTKGELLISGSVTKGTLDVVMVQLRIDSGDWMNVSGDLSWTYTLDTTRLKNGRHILKARAFDGMESSDTVNRTIVVDNTKAAAKGFIPGFDGIMVFACICGGVVLLFRRRR